MFFVFEGKRTEKKIYKAWLGHCFPQLKEVEQPADLQQGTFFLISGEGYPGYLKLIPQAFKDCADYGADHLFICGDAEERTYAERHEELQGILTRAAEGLQQSGQYYAGRTHVIVAMCCIETWLLGHRKLIPRQPVLPELAEYKRFYDVSLEDPERMGCPTGNRLERARFHETYLKRVFEDRGQAYRKERPGMAIEANYLAALRDRCLAPESHLASFRVLWDTWVSLGARHEVER